MRVADVGALRQQSPSPHIFVSLFYRRLVLWTLLWLLALTCVLTISSLLGLGGRFDFINMVVVFSSMLLLNAVWFFDININVNTEVWLQERGRKIFVSLLTLLSCVTSTFVMITFFQSRKAPPIDSLSTFDLLFCAILSSAALLYRYDTGWWRDAIIKYPWSLQDEGDYKKRDGDVLYERNVGIPLKLVRTMTGPIGKEIIASVRWSFVIVTVIMITLFLGRHMYAKSICDVDSELVKSLAHCQAKQSTGHNIVSYLRLSYNSMWVSLLIQLLPLTMLSTLKMLILSPVSFISPSSYKGGGVESTSSLRRSQSNVAPENEQPATGTLTSALCFGMNSIRRVIRFSWATSSYNTTSALSPVSAPRWQEAWYVYRDIHKELLGSLKVSFLGPPAVPYLQNGGGGFMMDASGGRLHTIMRSLAMEDFALIASSETRGLVQCRKQLFLSGWCDAVAAALTFISAFTLQVQLITCHAMEEVLEQQQRRREARLSDRGQDDSSRGNRSTRASQGGGQNAQGEDVDMHKFKFNQIMGGHFQVKNLDRIFSIPDEVVALIRKGKDHMDRSFMGYLGNKMLLAWSWSSLIRPLLRALYARYPFAHALPPFLLQTCINAVTGVSAGLQNALTDDATGTAEYHLIPAVELLIKLELSLEEFEVCMRRCHVNVLTDMRRVRSLDIRTLQIKTAAAVDALVAAYRDVLSRSDCPLLQDQCVAPVLLQRIKSMR